MSVTVAESGRRPPPRDPSCLRVVGLMSGTSGDGVDAALVDVPIDRAGGPPRLVAFRTVPFDEAGERCVRALLDLGAPGALGRPGDEPLAPGPQASRAVCRADFEVGAALARALASFLEAEGAAEAGAVDLVGSHGHTAWHDVDAATGRVTSTLQLGEAAVLAERCGVTVVSDMRAADVAAGGQGAPLASVWDEHFMRGGAAGGCRAVVNIGGVANATVLPPGGAPAAAFDTGPGNALMDWAAEHVADPRLRMDEGGRLAAAGRVHEPLLAAMLADAAAAPFLARRAPKTTGRELFGAAFARRYAVEHPEAAGLTPPDVLATLAEFTAATLADALLAHAGPGLGLVVVNGGGAHNPHLVARLRARLPAACRVAAGEAPDAKEAVLFAYLAALCVAGRAGSVPSCTGARGARVLGKITPGANFGELMARVWGGGGGGSGGGGGGGGGGGR